MAKMTTAIRDILYTKVVEVLSKADIMKKYKGALSRFMSSRTQDLYDTAPCERILFGDQDRQDLFNSIGISKEFIESVIDKTYYGDIELIEGEKTFCRQAKDEFTILAICIIKYFVDKKDQKGTELSGLHLAFSGKFYPSIHYKSYKIVKPTEYRYVMDYVVNNVLTNKYDLKRTGSVIGAITCVVNTWVEAYKQQFKEFQDDDVVYIIQQLHSRISAFMKNIAKEYYKAYEMKDKVYMSYTSDEIADDSNYHIADSDSLRAERIAERTISYMHTAGVDYKICQTASDTNVRTQEIKSIIESIITNPDNVQEISELVRLMIVDYFSKSKDKDVTDIDFITYSISPKPNTKNPEIVRQKEIVEGWLMDNSPAYRRRKSRNATKNSYYRSIYTYFTLMIHNANK